MSIAVSMEISAAIKYNKHAALKLGWYNRIPDGAKEDFTGLKEDPVLGTRWEREHFARAVIEFQSQDGFVGEIDGKLGKVTAEAVILQYIHEEEGTSTVMQNGIPLSIPVAQVINWKEEIGLSLHEDGGFRKVDGRKPRIVVLHWGGLNAQHCRNVLASADLSSHFGVDPTGTYQWLDLGYSAYHAGYVNNYAAGVDICQHPLPEHLERYADSDVEVIDNPTDRGEKKILSLDSDVAARVHDLVFGICEVLDIPAETVRDDKGKVSHEALGKEFFNNPKTTGVYGHHHVSGTKWDIAPWWQQIFGGTSLGD